MDPKMDSGIVCRYYSVDEAIESGAAPVPVSLDKTGDVQCIIDIMDHLLACEVVSILHPITRISLLHSNRLLSRRNINI